MAIANFEEACKGVCELAGMQPPVLAPDDKGTWAVTVHMQGVEVGLLQFAAAPSDAAYLIARLGALPEDGALAAWQALMDANLQMLGEQAPVFSRHPGSGEPLVQWTCRLGTASVVDIYRRVCGMVDLACRWRENPLLAGAQAGSLSHIARLRDHRSSASEAQRRQFEALHEAVRKASNQPVGPLLAAGDGCGFSLIAADVPVHVLHLPQRDVERAFVLIPLGNPSTTSELADVDELMTANFVLMTECHGATFSRHPSSGTLMLHYALALQGASAHGLLAQAAAVSAFASDRHGTGGPEHLAHHPAAAFPQLA